MKVGKIIIIAGARPNFIKIAPLMKAIAAHNENRRNGTPALQALLVHTGQHYDDRMSQIFFVDLGIPPPDVNLEVGSGTHAAQTAIVMTRFEAICLKESPDWVVVVGDVNSTLACTLVAAKLGLKVAHIEAGLRSFDRTMPEEINRIVTDVLADLLLTPSADADANLLREGIASAKIRRVGNIMIDAMLENLPIARKSTLLSQLGVRPAQFTYVTLHRPSNVDNEDSLRSIISELARVASQLPVVFPMHPRTRKMCQRFGISLQGSRGLIILDPIGYHDSLCLTEHARFVLTDSGGLQEESTYFRTPCLTLRPSTERPVTIDVGSNRLTLIDRLPSDIAKVLSGPPKFGNIPPLWDGSASVRIVQQLVGHL